MTTHTKLRGIQGGRRTPPPPSLSDMSTAELIAIAEDRHWLATATADELDALADALDRHAEAHRRHADELARYLASRAAAKDRP